MYGVVFERKKLMGCGTLFAIGNSSDRCRVDLLRVSMDGPFDRDEDLEDGGLKKIPAD